uniref:C-type lectin domain-containing protein n=1 Tax=Neogobius melanostomus TaxID=47308 RepID=A0A8C6WE87_9GOBI
MVCHWDHQPWGYQNWFSGDPNLKYIGEKCVEIYDGSWHDYTCSRSWPFVCSTGMFVSCGYCIICHINFETSSSWENAVAHCRANHSELATIESSAENSEVTSLVASLDSSIAWIGLYRESWRWSDNTPVNFTNWRSVGDDIRGLHCVAETADHVWSPTGCDAQLPFFCQAGKAIFKTINGGRVFSVFDI